MSTSTDKTSCIQHRPKCPFIIIYADFIEIAGNNHKVAAFLRVLETKTNERITQNDDLIEAHRLRGKPTPKTSLWIEMAYSDFVSRAQGLFQRSSFLAADKESEKLGFSKSRMLTRQTVKEEKTEYVYIKEYIMVQENVQAALDGEDLPYPIDSEEFKDYGTGKGADPLLKTKAPPFENKGTPPLKTKGGYAQPPFENKRNEYSKECLNKEKEDITAQSPIGELCSSSSPPSAHTQEDEPTLPPALQSTINNIGSKRSNPCPLSPSTEEKKPGRKPKELTVTETAVLDKWEDLQGSPVDRHKKDMRDAASYFAGLIEQGRMALDDIALERAAFLKQFPYSQTGHITLPQLHTKISTGGRAIKNSPIVIDAPSQDDKHSRYNDPNFNPGTLSFPEYAAWTEWKQQHQPDTVLV